MRRYQLLTFSLPLSTSFPPQHNLPFLSATSACLHAPSPTAVDAHELGSSPSVAKGGFTKAFSNAALHWILACPQARREAFFADVRDALAGPGATFAFETGGPGNVAEMRAALLMGAARHAPGGLDAARAADPWFFADERWVRDTLERRVGGWRVDRVEVEHRPTPADAGGVDGWVRLMGSRFFEAVPEDRREACVREVVDVLTEICRNPSGDGFTFGYVRMRVLATKL